MLINIPQPNRNTQWPQSHPILLHHLRLDPPQIRIFIAQFYDKDKAFFINPKKNQLHTLLCNIKSGIAKSKTKAEEHSVHIFIEAREEINPIFCDPIHHYKSFNKKKYPISLLQTILFPFL